MVKTLIHPRSTIIVLSPNRSASWTQTKLFITVIAIFVAMVAIAWAFAGAWVVLPFAGLEISLLAYLMYRGCYKSYQQQVIRVEPNTITIEQGVHQPVQKVQLCKQGVHLSVIEAETEFDVTRLNLIEQGQQIEIGGFLNQRDTKEALMSLQQAGVTVCSNKWWKY